MTTSTHTASGHTPFAQDIVEHGAYRYTGDDRLSSRIANERLTAAVLDAVSLAGLRVLDSGCGDGTYTIALFDRGHPASMIGVDPASEAIAHAAQLAGARPIVFATEDACRLPYEDDAFDLVHIRGVLHHLDTPRRALAEALRVSRRVVVVEPNGYNLGLKALERLSAYHRAHGERSFPPALLDRWVDGLGGAVRDRRWVGLVPFFCPDLVARGAKAVEPLVEAIPGVRQVACAVYISVIERVGPPGGGRASIRPGA